MQKAHALALPRGILAGGYERLRGIFPEHSACNWIAQNQPEIWDKTYKFVQISAYLNYRLTGVLADSVAAQVGHLPRDYKKKKWMSKWQVKYAVFNVPAEKFPTLYEPGKALGALRRRRRRTAACPRLQGDCGGLGQGLRDGGQRVHRRQPGQPELWDNLHCAAHDAQICGAAAILPAYPAVLPGKYNPEIQIYRGFWMVTWFKEQFARLEAGAALDMGSSAERMLDESLALTPPRGGGAACAALLGPGLKTPEARGAMVGFHSGHTRSTCTGRQLRGFAMRCGTGLRA